VNTKDFEKSMIMQIGIIAFIVILIAGLVIVWMAYKLNALS